MRSVAIEPIHSEDNPHLEGHRGECKDHAEGGRALWRFFWPLAFIVLMTLLSEFGPRTLFSKLPPAPSAASEPAVHVVK